MAATEREVEPLETLAVVEEVKEEPKEPEIPEKYKDKSPADLVRMHQEAERLIGRQGSEVGELRKVIDDFIKDQTAKLNTKNPAEKVDFFVEPERAIEEAIENHPSVRESKEAAKLARQTAAKNEITGKHPDFMGLVQDQDFLEWVGKSPARIKLLREANSFDVDSADLLFGDWKERKELISKTVKDDRKLSLKGASTGSPTASSERSRKTYRRADILKLMETDPRRYEALMPEIRQAYAEGRVK